jgi:hypothetical protein
VTHKNPADLWALWAGGEIKFMSSWVGVSADWMVMELFSSLTYQAIADKLFDNLNDQILLIRVER